MTDAEHVAAVRARLIAKDPRFAQAVVGKKDPVAKPATALYPCPHRAAESHRSVLCKGCGGRVELFVFACSRGYEECTLGKKADGVAGCCKTCPDRPTIAPAAANRPKSGAGRSPSPVTAHPRGSRPALPPIDGRRHCLMHVYPVPGNGVWQRSIAQLASRRGLFDGRIVIAVATGDKLDPAADVVRLAPWADVIEVKNDPALREVTTWGPLWANLTPHLGPADAVLYCHTKGATRPVDPGNSCQWWGSLMWSLALDHWPLVRRTLAEYPITGSFLKLGAGFTGSPSEFHYSGTFFWLRADDFLKTRRAVPPSRKWWGVEAWPGLAYKSAEAGCVFHANTVPALDLYLPDYWTNTIRPEYEAWLKENPPSWEWATATANRP